MIITDINHTDGGEPTKSMPVSTGVSQHNLSKGFWKISFADGFGWYRNMWLIDVHEVNVKFISAASKAGKFI